MQACYYTNADAHAVLPLTPNITVLRMKILHIDPALTRILSCAPLLRHVEVETLICRMWRSEAPETLQALRSLPQSITWRPLELPMIAPKAQGTVQEMCAAFASAPLAQAVSKLTLNFWQVEPPIAALRATFPNVLHFELRDNCNQITASSLSEAVAAWPMLRSIILATYNFQKAQGSQQHLEAAARMVAELRAKQPFEVVLRVGNVSEGDAARMDVLVAAIHNAGGGKACVRWMHR